MKVSEIPYKRYTIEEGRAVLEKIKEIAKNAKNADDMMKVHDLYVDCITEVGTAIALANCRFTLNTRDEFYAGEMGYYDEVTPLFEQIQNEYEKLILDSPYLPEIENRLGERIIKMYRIHQKCFDDNVIADMQEENGISTEYSKFMSELVFEYDGEKMPLSVLRGKLEDSDRNVRRKCAEAIGRGLEAHSEELDSFYDRLVKVRDRIAKKLGYKNFVELGYYRMGRLDYNAEMVAQFRDNVKESLVPVVAKLKEKVGRELSVDKFMFYDDAVYSNGEEPKPILDAKGIFEAAQEMYDEMSPEVGGFMRSMLEAEAFDCESRDGKWGGGYCTGFAKYKQPFILANFNGSSGDIDVITHEFGHALAANFAFNGGDPELEVGGMETAECHSMSMEFLCWKFMDKFFGGLTNEYKKKHVLSCLSFIPYGVIVDEFQHNVYEHPEYTPAERDAMYLELEKKYRPYMSLEGIPYLEKGTRWQYQMHIFESPFYYIDYCLAQTVALGFLIESLENYDSALERYLTFASFGGTKSFPELVAGAGLMSPFTHGALDKIAAKIIDIAEKL